VSRLVGPPAPATRHGTLAAMLAAAARHPSGVIFVGLREEEERLTWAEVDARARRVAGALVARGVRPGDRVAVVLRTGPAFLDAFFGAVHAGAVPVPLYPPVRLGRMDEYADATARMLRVSGARALVTSSGVAPVLGRAVAGAGAGLDLGLLDAARLLEGRATSVARAAGDLALVQFSSGSTVDPKPVALTNAALGAQVDALTALVSPTDADVLVSWLPLYHDMGLIGCLLGAVSYPGPLVLIAPEHFLARPALWLRALSRHRGTISAAPHFAYAYAADRVTDADLAGTSFAPWRIALDGAEPVTPGALRRFAERLGPHGFDPGSLMPVYGLSEAALAVTFSPRGRPTLVEPVEPGVRPGERIGPGRRAVVSVGVPVPGVEVEVRGEAGEPLPERRLGTIHVRGPSLMQGYLGDPRATARVLVGGWLDTGDLGFHAGGELFVHGRAKDVVIVRGANHAPDEFESCLEGVPGVRPGCAVALGVVPEGGDAEVLVLLVERPRGERGPAAPVEAAVADAVAAHTGVRPHAVHLLEAGTLPRTSSGKMRRAEALRRFQAGTLRPPRKATAFSLAAEVVAGRIARMRHRR
jgi:fatty-acyl-CoA synthase